MVLVITSHGQIPKNVAFKEKKLHKNKFGQLARRGKTSMII
jgi:hypothetical protein